MNFDLIDKFVKNLNDIPDIKCQVLTKSRINYQGDALIQIEVNKKKLIYQIEIKNKILPNSLGLSENIKRKTVPVILLANYITPKVRNSLHDRKFSYADEVGNLFISSKEIYLYKEVGKSGRENIVKPVTELGKAGLQVVFQFLINDEYINKPYRFIAEEALVTIDTVRRTILFLLKEKFILQKEKREYVFNRRIELFELWVYEYNRKLKPKLSTERFRTIKPNIDWDTGVLPDNTYWGGVRAAEILTNNIIANEQIMYSSLDYKNLLPALMHKLPVVRDPEGDLIVRQIFWKSVENDNRVDFLVHPILIYADLISSDDPRILEAANIIYKNDVEPKL